MEEIPADDGTRRAGGEEHRTQIGRVGQTDGGEPCAGRRTRQAVPLTPRRVSREYNRIGLAVFGSDIPANQFWFWISVEVDFPYGLQFEYPLGSVLVLDIR